jgi:hypothetical protein
MVEDKYIGLALAVTSTLGIGASFVITKKGLNAAAERHGFEGDGYAYLRNGTWWAGIITMVVGEICNFSAYAFAPAILVTPLGALSVLIGAVLGSYFLGEQLGILGRVGCAICLIGSVIIVLHAPPDKDLRNVGELLNYALQPGMTGDEVGRYTKGHANIFVGTGFLIYCFIVTSFAVAMIYKVAPKYGKKNPMVYLSICSTVGSISIMAIKGFGIAIKLTLGGHNQLANPSTYVFLIVVVVCILTQMNYFNKALSQFSTNMYFNSPPRHQCLLTWYQRQPTLLRNLHNLHPHCLLHPLRRLQHHRRRQHHLPPRRLPHHLHRRLPPQPLPRGS